MGLCKCPKKKVTNLFCYEHRVNVCDHCLVDNHHKCIVQSYLAWLQDSDYDPRCALCSEALASSDAASVRPTVRLLCLHVFHQDCLHAHCQAVYDAKPNTAPAGYRCPVCQEQLFPKQNHVSPIASDLRTFLKSANWARSGLGLPLLTDYQDEHQPMSQPDVIVHSKDSKPHGQNFVSSSSADGKFSRESSVMEAVQIDNANPTTARKGAQTASLDEHGAAKSLLPGSEGDADDDKYKRRSAFVWLKRWLRSRGLLNVKRRDPLSAHKKILCLLILFIVGLITLITVGTRVSHSSTESDPLLDPLANPNVRVAPDIS